ncbi:MAG TPA: carboxypeptidase-like regulatory domain-containing protein [Vicinamibacterales bacterium]|nr:carboxypeptidase-like regulatory domain-containing protein [Vicinamibacterales bacterium]
MRCGRFVGGAIVAAFLAATSVGLRSEQNVVISGSGPTLENREMPKGTGLVMGRVLEADSKSAVSGAIIWLRHNSGAAPDPAMTDDQGRFVFRDLPKGQYTLRSTRAGYVDGAYAKRLPDEEPGRDGRPLDLADDERIGDLTLTMWRHAAIGGAVVDELGEPLVGVTVRAVPRRIVAGRSQYELDYTSIADRTDDRGLFRLSSLTPGDYLVAVPNVTGALAKQRSPSTPASVPSSLNESSTGGLRWTADGGYSLRAGGIEVGDADSLLVATGPEPLPGFAGVTPDGKVLGYETQFYPGVTTIARATAITLRSGEERTGIVASSIVSPPRPRWRPPSRSA